MAKILSRSGDSLADVYDVQGSIAGIECLASEEVSLVHEMGETIFSERLAVTIRKLSSTAILQSTNFDVFFDNNPSSIMRVLGVVVITSADRVANCTVNIRRPDQDTEIPLWNWDTAVDGQVNGRLVVSGSVLNTIMLVPAVPISPMPNLMLGTDQFDHSADIAFRGTTTAFGAGTVTVQLLLYLAFARTAGISSYGLPIPGW